MESTDRQTQARFIPIQILKPWFLADLSPRRNLSITAE